MDNPIYGVFRVYGAAMNTSEQIDQLRLRLRMIRESKNLTLQEAARLSHGAITAIALGSYERGDRSISAIKLLKIAQMYGVPVHELFVAPDKSVNNRRTTLDLRKLKNTETDLAIQLAKILSKIAKQRSDWNGEIISLRSEDLTNFAIFGGFEVDEIEAMQQEFSMPRSK